MPSDITGKLRGVADDDAEKMVKCPERFGIAQTQYGQKGEKKMTGLHNVVVQISRELAAEEGKCASGARH